jgi:TatD DNase family protein
LLQLIDTHAHIDELQDLEPALTKAKESGVSAIVAVGSNHESNQKIMMLAASYKGFIYPALGLHPWELGNLDSDGINLTMKYIEENITQIVAIGEIGLDYDKRVIKVALKELQKHVLKRLLALAARYAKPVIIHSRYAWKDSFDIVREAGIERAVFHWFTGFSSVLREILDTGYFISATPAAEYHEEHRRAIKETPSDRLLLETDCPVTYGRENKYRSRPADVIRSLKAAALLKGIEDSVLARQTTRTAIRFFNLNSANPDFASPF